MNLEQLRAALRQKHGALAGLKAKAFGADSTPEDEKALETFLDEMEALNKKIELAEKAEKAEAESSLPAETPTGAASVPAAPAQAKTAQAEEILGLTAGAILVARGKGISPFKCLEDEGYSGLAKVLGHANREKAVNTLVSADGGVLVPAAQVGSIIPLLRVESSFLDAGPTRVPMINGKFAAGRGATGATASYVAEGALKPLSTPTFDSITMQSKKLAGIVPITKEAMMWTIGDIEGYVRADLRAAMATTLDLNAWLGTGSGSSPLGILLKSGIQTFTPSFVSATAPTLAELDTMANGMIMLLVTNKLYNTGRRWRWVMSYRTAMRLATVRDANGNTVFPTMEGVGVDGGTPVFKGIPVIVNAQIPTNGGGTTDETTLALVDFGHVLFGEEEGITMKASDQATLDTDGAGTLLHLFQQNMIAILAEAMHDFGLRYAKAVVKATIRW